MPKRKVGYRAGGRLARTKADEKAVRSETDMNLATEEVKRTRFIVRQSCDYSRVIEAYTPEEAIEIAKKVPLGQYDIEWSPYEAEKE